MPKDKHKVKITRTPGLPRGKTMADVVDKYVLYQLSVQEPEHEAAFFDRVYEARHGRKPRVLREDFCGTFAVCCEWVKLGEDRRAIGVDLDPEPLEWGKAHNLTKAPEDRRGQIELRLDDVRTHGEPRADILAAQNFSFWLFKTRPEAINYFRTARDNLADGGLMIIDMMGGGECFEEEHEDVRSISGYDKAVKHRDDKPPCKIGKFKYVWEQHRFNPITHDASFYIHFRFKDGSRWPRAFEYHWRFWTIPEVREMLAEAGFRESIVYWENEDEDADEQDAWQPAEQAPSDPSWIAYIVAVR